MTDNDQPDLATEVADLVYHLSEALSKALPFVHRQKMAGKHEQDRKDAEEWLQKYGEVADQIYTVVQHSKEESP